MAVRALSLKFSDLTALLATLELICGIRVDLSHGEMHFA